MSVSVGSVAPDFTLKNQNTEDVTLSSFRGKKVVVLFFPFANTSVCTKEMCTFRDALSDYKNLDAQVLGISVDSPFSLKLWDDKNNYGFPLLSDFNKEVSTLYGVLYESFVPAKFDYKGVAKRSAFVLDENGVVKYAEVLEVAGDEPNYDNIQAALKS
ncbi:MAG: peroxiredoxin [Ignavibacteriaceae bacterium]|nr:peroxiredoxin [Ignavibacteriaceae bacterium]HRI48361.1 peroxiredoxin [Ignavibacteriaceae bacterium]